MKTIIIYSTKYGSVEKAALKLKEHLKGDVEVCNVKNNPGFIDYDVVILGGSIYAGRVQSVLKKYIHNNLSKLKEKKIGLFICAGTEKEADINSYLVNNFTQELYDRAIAKANFGYEYDLKKFSFIDRLAVRIVGGVKKSKATFYNEAIREFAGKVNNS